MKITNIPISSCLRLVPLQELEEQTLLKVLEIYGHPYGLQHKDIPEILKNRLEKEIPAKISEAWEKVRKDRYSIHNREKCSAPLHENLLWRLLSAVRTGNRQCQIQILSEMYRIHQYSRNQRYGHALSPDLFLLKMKHYISCRGLSLDIGMREFVLGK